MNSLLRTLGFAAGLAVGAGALAAASPGLTKIYESFVVAEYAANKCEPADAATQDKFRANFALVASFARKELMARFPGSTDAQADKALKETAATLIRRVEEVIRDEGCGAEKIRNLVTAYRRHANWDAAGPAAR